MHKTSFITYMAAILAVISTVSCSKKASPKTSTQIQELGNIELTVQSPKRVPIGGGTNLVFSQSVLPDGKVRVALDIEPEAAGAYPAYNHAQFTLQPGVGDRVFIAGRWISFTPKLVKP